eukprot:Lithocolla_globosa_v1_NODE_4592_length_1404_cov_5.340252.p3 type:complete len:108 gc:universal NODE_4592_length_1404_cov_5.340252:946-623(-)
MEFKLITSEIDVILNSCKNISFESFVDITKDALTITQYSDDFNISIISNQKQTKVKNIVKFSIPANNLYGIFKINNELNFKIAKNIKNMNDTLEYFTDKIHGKCDFK